MNLFFWPFSYFFPRKIHKSPVIIIAHRGASGYEPENTLRAFKRALEMKAPMIELDVQLCKTEEIVVMHDETIDRTTDEQGSVAQLTWKELKIADAGKGEPIPLLYQVFDLVNKQAIIMVEIKDPRAAKPVATLINHYVKNKGWSFDNFIVSSFNSAAVAEFKRNCPQVKTGLIFDEKQYVDLNLVKQLQAQYIVVDYMDAHKELIKKIHTLNKQIYAYTVNDKRVAQELSRLSVDGIITNYPDILENQSS